MKIIVYGIGKKGLEFIQDVQEVLKYINIVAVTDTYIQNLDSQYGNDLCYISPYCIKNYEFDYIVVTSENSFGEIRNLICSYGISKNKIKTIKEIIENSSNIYCELCGNYPGVWKYIGKDYDIFIHKKIEGASRRRGGCPICGSTDRERFVYHVIKNYTIVLDGKKHSVLHFAPEKMLSRKIKEICTDAYITADIVEGRANVKADITCLQFSDEQFEFIICNHVMEHISEEKKAFSEVKRCLKKDGILILTVPICWEQKTFEDKNIITETERIKYFGQIDHVRLYGNDIVERIGEFGFSVRPYFCDEILNKKEQKKFGYLSRDVVLLCKRLG